MKLQKPQSERSPGRFARWGASLAAAFALNSPSTSLGQAPWGTPLAQDGIAAITCAARITTPATPPWVFSLVDLRNPAAADYGPCGMTAPLWNPAMYHHPSWTVSNLGCIFGICQDKDGDYYVAAHGLYSKTWMPYYLQYGTLGGGATSLAAAGTVYKIDKMTGVPSVFSVIPGQQATNLGGTPNWITGPGLGNIAYDQVNDQFFVTSLEDGKIYRVGSAGGAPIDSFDPLVADNGAVGMPARPERLWGIGVRKNEVIYAVCNDGFAPNLGKIRRVNLAPGGAFIGSSDVEILTVPAGPSWVTYVPVADIEFSADENTMVFGTRTMLGEADSYNHASAMYRATLTGAVWTVTHNQPTGCNAVTGEAYGGVALGPEGGTAERILWGTSADTATGSGPHGIFGVRVSDLTTAGSPALAARSWKVPFDPAFTQSGPDIKGSGGDVDIMVPRGCMDLRHGIVNCPTDATGNFSFPLSITNRSGVTANYLLLQPCPAALLPAGAVTASPSPGGVVTIAPLADGATFAQPVSIPFAGNSGKLVCFQVVLLDRTGAECCSQKICVPMPKCECASILDQRITCERTADGLIKYTLVYTIQNNTNLSGSPFGFWHAVFLPPVGFSPAVVTPSPSPIPPGGTGTVTATYYGSPGTVCFSMSLHSQMFDKCCSLDSLCVTFPPCTTGGGGGTTDKPDTCHLDERVFCCPVAGSTVPVATTTLTVCNNSTVPRTYTWTANPLAPTAACPIPLATSNFAPAAGTIGPVAPGSCLSIPITIRCANFDAGACGAFEICVSQPAPLAPLCCRAVVARPAAGEVIIKKPDGSPTTVIPSDVGVPVTLSFLVENTAATAVVAKVGVMDLDGLVEFSAAGGTAASATARLSLDVSVPAGGKTLVSLTAYRLVSGGLASESTRLAVWATRGLLDFTTAPTALFTLLTPSPRQIDVIAPMPNFALQGMQVLPDPQPIPLNIPIINISVPTIIGERYRLQSTRSLLLPWEEVSCFSPDAQVNEHGDVIGTGGPVNVQVNCDAGAHSRFYRAVMVK